MTTTVTLLSALSVGIAVLGAGIVAACGLVVIADAIAHVIWRRGG